MASTFPSLSSMAKLASWSANHCRAASEMKPKKWGSVAHLKAKADVAWCREACLEEGRDDPAFVTTALGIIARALARKTGLTRERPCKALLQRGYQ